MFIANLMWMKLLDVGVACRPVHKRFSTFNTLVAWYIRVNQDVSVGVALVLELL